MLSHQLVRGLLDSDIQEKILSKAADKTELTLQDITNLLQQLDRPPTGPVAGPST